MVNSNSSKFQEEAKIRTIRLMSGVLILEIGGSGGVGGFEIPPLKCRKISRGGGK